jgi:F0F1-type ATP synthase membrane subunit b/b'
MVLAETSIQLVPDGTLLLHLFMVVVMVYVLNRTLLKPINQILAEREKQITSRQTEAQKLAAESEEKRKRYHEALHAARVDGYKLLERERAEAIKEKDEKVRLYREQMSKQVATEVENTRRQEERVKGELEGQAATISNLISSQILRRPSQ